MSAVGDVEVTLACILAAVAAHQRARKRAKVMVVLALAEGGDDRERHAHHYRVPRVPLTWAARLAGLSERQFKRRYRMPKACFSMLVNDLAPDMLRQHVKLKHRIPHGVEPAVQVSAAIRYLAGGSYLDITDIHGISETTLYQSVHAFVFALINHPRYRVRFPIDDEDELRRIAAGWASHDRTDKFSSDDHGCVGALDGLIVEVFKPRLSECANPANYKNRKGAFALIVQVVCDARRRVLYASATSNGSTHDSTAWGCSVVGQAVERGELPAWAYFVADDAYVSGNQMLVPYGGKCLPPWKDSFNFYQSSLRIEIECTLGAVQARWGILWRPLRCSLSMAPHIIMACFCLHNVCTDAGMPASAQHVPLSRVNGDADGALRRRRADGNVEDQPDGPPPNLFPRFQSQGYHDADHVGRGRNAPSAQRSDRRERIAREIDERGMQRPPVALGARHGRAAGL